MRNKEIYRNEIKSYIIRAGMTMSEAVEILADEYPALAKKCEVSLPDEKTRRVGQSVAAASLPRIK